MGCGARCRRSQKNLETVGEKSREPYLTTMCLAVSVFLLIIFILTRENADGVVPRPAHGRIDGAPHKCTLESGSLIPLPIYADVPFRWLLITTGHSSLSSGAVHMVAFDRGDGSATFYVSYRPSAGSGQLDNGLNAAWVNQLQMTSNDDFGGGNTGGDDDRGGNTGGGDDDRGGNAGGGDDDRGGNTGGGDDDRGAVEAAAAIPCATPPTPRTAARIAINSTDWLAVFASHFIHKKKWFQGSYNNMTTSPWKPEKSWSGMAFTTDGWGEILEHVM